MSFEELRAFLAVAEHESFVAAAISLGLPRTTLRRHVDALEARTGVALLERRRAGVVLTEAGRRLAERGRGLELEFSSLLEAVRETAAAPTGLVRALLPVGLPTVSIAAFVGLLRASWSGVRLHLRFADAPLAGALTDVDLVAWFGTDLPPGAWECHTLQPTPLRLVATRRYLETHGAPRTLDELTDHPLFVWLPGASAEPALTTPAGARVPVRAAIATTNVDLLHDCAHRGLGLAWLPDGGLPPPPGMAPVEPVLPDLAGAPCELRVAAPRALAALPRVQVFLANLAAITAAGRAAR